MLWNLTIKAITKRLKEEGGAIQLLLAPLFSPSTSLQMLWNLTIKAITKRLKEEGGAMQLLLAPFFFSFHPFANALESYNKGNN
jgi:hypothetical protein